MFFKIKNKAYGSIEYVIILGLLLAISLLLMSFIKGNSLPITNVFKSTSDKISKIFELEDLNNPVNHKITVSYLNPFDYDYEKNIDESIIHYFRNSGFVNVKDENGNIRTDYLLENIQEVGNFFQVDVVLDGERITEIKSINRVCHMPSDEEFSGSTGWDFMYIGSAKCVIIPNEIKGVEVYSYERMFEGTAIEKVISTNPNIEYMGAMFAKTTSSQIDLTEFDTSSAKDFGWMFSESKATNIIFGENFKTSEVTNMQSMFTNSIIQDLNLSSFETSNVTNMDRMFYGSNIKNLNLSSFNTSSLVDALDGENPWYIGGACWMFHSSKIETLQLGVNFKLEHIKYLGNIFYNSSITELDVSNIDFSVSSSTLDPGNPLIRGMDKFLNGSKISTLYVKDQNMENLINSIPSEFRNSLTQIIIKGD